MKSHLYSYKQCLSRRDVEHFAKERKCTITNGGAHALIVAPNGQKIAEPRHNSISPGVARQIFRWLIALPLAVFLLIFLIGMLT